MLKLLIRTAIISPNKKGCLHDKSYKEKIEFFESLYRFKTQDLIFYNEQIRDLKYDELEQFNTWIFKNKYQVKH